MHEIYLSPRRNLISALLVYPKQATKILYANQVLIDRSLVQLIKLVSSRMETSGNHEAANFLDTIVEKINIEFLANGHLS